MFKKIEIWILYLTILLMLLFALIFGFLVRQEAIGKTKLGIVSQAALFLAELPVYLRDILLLNYELTIIDRFPQKKGFVGSPLKNEAYLLMSRYDGDTSKSIVELYDLRDFSLLHTWAPDIWQINQSVNLQDPLFRDHNINSSPERYRMNHPLLLEDGGLIFQNSSPLVKIDICGKQEWQNDKFRFHHSNEIDSEGFLWVPAHAYPYLYENSALQKDNFSYLDDSIVSLDISGNVVYQKSISSIFQENKLGYLLHSLGSNFEPDPLHVNDIQPVNFDGKYWKKGDLFVSVARQSMVFLFRPSTSEVLWYLVGPLARQHDINILNEHQISIFNNNSFINSDGESYVDGQNKILIYDFLTEKHFNLIEDSLLKHDVRTITEGRLRLADGIGFFIEETDYGRTLFFDTEGNLLWEYINRSKEGYVYRTSWSRLLFTADEIKKVNSIFSNYTLDTTTRRCQNEK